MGHRISLKAGERAQLTASSVARQISSMPEALLFSFTLWALLDFYMYFTLRGYFLPMLELMYVEVSVYAHATHFSLAQKSSISLGCMAINPQRSAGLCSLSTGITKGAIESSFVVRAFNLA